MSYRTRERLITIAGYMVIVLGGTVFTTAIYLLTVLAGPLFGALSAWILLQTPVGQWLLDGFQSLGLPMTKDGMMAVGAVLGWIGGFFKSYSSTGNKKEE